MIEPDLDPERREDLDNELRAEGRMDQRRRVKTKPRKPRGQSHDDQGGSKRGLEGQEVGHPWETRVYARRAFDFKEMRDLIPLEPDDIDQLHVLSVFLSESVERKRVTIQRRGAFHPSMSSPHRYLRREPCTLSSYPFLRESTGSRRVVSKMSPEHAQQMETLHNWKGDFANRLLEKFSEAEIRQIDVH